MDITPSGIWLLSFTPSVVWLTGFTPTLIWFICNDIIPNEDFRVFVPWCQATLCFTCPILSLQPYNYSVIQISCIYSYIHIHIHAYKHSCTYNMHNIFYTLLHWQPCVLLQLYHKIVIPYFVRKRIVNHCYFPPKCRSLLCQITRCHPIFIFRSVSFPAWSGDEISRLLFSGLSDYEISSVSFPASLEDGMSRLLFPGLSDYGISIVSFSAWSEDGMSRLLFPSLSDYRVSSVSFPAW